MMMMNRDQQIMTSYDTNSVDRFLQRDARNITRLNDCPVNTNKGNDRNVGQRIITRNGSPSAEDELNVGELIIKKEGCMPLHKFTNFMPCEKEHSKVTVMDTLAIINGNEVTGQKTNQQIEIKSPKPLCYLDPDTSCGISFFKPQWLQRWATSGVYLFLFSFVGSLSGAYYTYRIGTMTTLEKRFAFKSKTSGAIMMIDELSPLLFGPVIGYFGGKAHRPRMLFFGMSIIAMACIVTAIPYFIYGPEEHLSFLDRQDNGTGIQMCDEDGVREEDCDADSRSPSMVTIAIIMIAGFMKGAGTLTFNSLGLTYMDDATKKTNVPLYLAIVFITRLFGPVLGFLLSSVCLLYAENPFEDPGYGPEDPRWIGAWWIGFFLQGVLLFLFAIPFIFFPRRLPGHPMIVDSEAEDRNNKSLLTSLKGFLVVMKRLLKNPLLAGIILHDILTIYAHAGYFMMLPKYMENQFRLSASDANLYSGPPGIAAVLLGTVIGSYLVWKYKPNPKLIILGMIGLEVMGAIGYSIKMIPRCETIELSHSGINDEGFILDSVCNSNCNCFTKEFTPVCGSDDRTVYFSPCHAGCTAKLNETFTGCSCASNFTDSGSETVTSGFCSSDNCWTHALIYLTIVMIAQFLINMLRVPQTMLLIRCTPTQDKSAAIGVFEALTCTLGFVVYLVAYGAVVDTTCLVWEESCEETGNCWFYDVQRLNYMMHGSSILFSVISALSLLFIYRFSDRLVEFYEEEGDSKTTAVDNKSENA